MPILNDNKMELLGNLALSSTVLYGQNDFNAVNNVHSIMFINQDCLLLIHVHSLCIDNFALCNFVKKMFVTQIEVLQLSYYCNLLGLD